MKLKILFFLAGLFLNHIAQTDSATVRLVVNLKDQPETYFSVYVSGNNSKLGSWNPSLVALDKIDDSTFAIHFSCNKNTSLEYKFTKGDWSNEAVLENGNVPDNYTLLVKQDTTIEHSITNWKDEFEYELQGQITGEVNYIEQIKTRDDLLPRDIIIWLPPGYDEKPDLRYPVLYMHDGQNIIDPKTSSFGVDWKIDEVADSLITEQKIEPIIIVGINSTDNRYTEYSENDTGYSYIDFIAEDLKPLIDKKYRTKPDRKNTAIAGSSMGGLISFMAAWERPDIFSKAACLSPAFKIRNYDFVDNVQSYAGDKKKIQLYIDNGGVGLEDSLQYGVDEMLNVLRDKGFEVRVDLIYFKDKSAIHNEAAWAKRNWRYLTFFFGRDRN